MAELLLKVCFLFLLFLTSSSPLAAKVRIQGKGKQLRHPHDLGISKTPETQFAGRDSVGSCWIFPSSLGFGRAEAVGGFGTCAVGARVI